MKEVQNFEDGVWRLTVTVVDLTKKKKIVQKSEYPSCYKFFFLLSLSAIWLVGSRSCIFSVLSVMRFRLSEEFQFCRSRVSATNLYFYQFLLSFVALPYESPPLSVPVRVSVLTQAPNAICIPSLPRVLRPASRMFPSHNSTGTCGMKTPLYRVIERIDKCCSPPVQLEIVRLH